MTLKLTRPNHFTSESHKSSFVSITLFAIMPPFKESYTESCAIPVQISPTIIFTTKPSKINVYSLDSRNTQPSLKMTSHMEKPSNTSNRVFLLIQGSRLNFWVIKHVRFTMKFWWKKIIFKINSSERSS